MAGQAIAFDQEAREAMRPPSVQKRGSRAPFKVTARTRAAMSSSQKSFGLRLARDTKGRGVTVAEGGSNQKISLRKQWARQRVKGSRGPKKTNGGDVAADGHTTGQSWAEAIPTKAWLSSSGRQPCSWFENEASRSREDNCRKAQERWSNASERGQSRICKALPPFAGQQRRIGSAHHAPNPWPKVRQKTGVTRRRQSKTAETHNEGRVEGACRFDRGYLSPYFVPNRSAKDGMRYRDPFHSHLRTKKISNKQRDSLPVLGKSPAGQNKADPDHRRKEGERRGPRDAGHQQAARHLKVRPACKRRARRTRRKAC